MRYTVRSIFERKRQPSMHSAMRFLVLLAIPVVAFMGCKKSSDSVTAVIADSTGNIAGSWSGCIVQPQASCVTVSMTLVDSSVTDTSANVTGTGNWEENVTIKGKLVDALVTLNATATGVTEGWAFSGTASGNSIIGQMTTPGVTTAFPTTFTRSP
jgi:hypothetical protein